MALGELLRREGVDVVLLQEANVSSLEVLRDAAGLDWAVTAYDAGAPYPGGRSGRGRVTAVAGRGDEPTLARILPDLPLPERMVFARISTPLGPITMASYHAPPGVSHGFVKVQHAHALRDWVDTTGGPIVVGADANTPLVDHPEPGRVRTHWHTGSLKLRGRDGDDVVFGGAPEHRLRDAYRLYLQDHPQTWEEINRQRPDGPLAVSHRTGKRTTFPGTPRRFDTLWVSPRFGVRAMSYDYDGAVAAGSDHALVVAELTPSGGFEPAP